MVKRHKVRSSGKVVNFVVRPISHLTVMTYSTPRVNQTRITWNKRQEILAKRIKELRDLLKEEETKKKDLIYKINDLFNKPESFRERPTEKTLMESLKKRLGEAEKTVKIIKDEIEDTRKRWLTAIDNHITADTEWVERVNPALTRW
jgi:uncharacterized protein YlxW (UPF0749 family)